ncbi:AAA domain-containing protein [Favolaschia claudopus]|uniref:AAA domain-containing protein n=1 Tax=Favolaschia claudopus TaxID=2862362 RepID=A0AAW0ABE5_9AGAR
MAPVIKGLAAQKVIQSTADAASALALLAESSQTPFLATSASITKNILGRILTLKSHTEELVRMAEQIHDVLRGIIALQIASGPNNLLPPAVLHDIGFFAETLNKLQIWIENQQRASKIRRLFRQTEETAQLEVSKAGLKQALEVLGTQSRIAASLELNKLQDCAQLDHGEFMELLAGESDASSSYTRRSAPFDLGASSGSLSLIPAAPKIFHGRDHELQSIVDALRSGFPRIAILGPGGMGKTSLAIASLHDNKIVEKYPTRHFISCDSAHTSDTLVAIIASNLGLEPSRGIAKAIVRQLSAGPACRMVLDNFETPWEPMETRTQVEEFLSLLTDVPHLALLVTMRGAERPGQVNWTRPFLRPLIPLSLDAARQTFVDIADDFEENDAEVDKLLDLTDNVPLAVQLIATIAGSEGCAATLTRWESESTTLLSDGFDKRSNLEISIMLSLSSPRMRASPHSEELLRLMSLLSDGILDVDLVQSQLAIPDMSGCKITLVRTSLAYFDHTGRFKVLTPIREYISTARPPKPELVRPLRSHFSSLLSIWSTFMHRTLFVADLIPRLLSNLGNIHNMLLYGLERDPVDVGETMRSVILLNQLNRVMGRGLTPLLLRLPRMLEGMDDRELHAWFITEEFQAWQFYKVPNPEKSIEEAIGHFHVIQDLDGEARFYNVIAEYYLDRVRNLPKAKVFFERALSLASRCNSDVAQVRALSGLASMAWFGGRYLESRRLAGEVHKISLAAGDINGQRAGIRIQAMCCTSLGDFRQTLQLVAEAKELVQRTGMEGGEFENMMLNTEADVYQLKTEYLEARRLHELILSQTSVAQSPVTHAYALVNIAYLQIMTGVSADIVSQTLDTATTTFRNAQYPRGVNACDVYRADFLLREGEASRARAEYVRLWASLRGDDDELAGCCLAKLADPTIPVHDDAESARWAAVFLAFTLHAPTRNQLVLHQALRCFADVLARQGEYDASLSVFEIALEGFTMMDVHQSRAECMRTMGELYRRRGDIARAEELWKEARILFERSHQKREMAEIDRRLFSLRISDES